MFSQLVLSLSGLMLVLNQIKMGPCKIRTDVIGGPLLNQITDFTSCKTSFSKFEHELAPCASFAMERGTGGNVNVGL